MKQQLTLILMLFLYSTNAFSQNPTEAQKEADIIIRKANLEYYAKNYQQSLVLYEKALMMPENQYNSNYYNAACTAALVGNKPQAWTYLDQAISKGFDNYRHLFADKDLIILHADKKWTDLLDKYDINLNKIKAIFAPYTRIPEGLSVLVPFSKGNLWGYMERGTKKVLIQPMFQEADFFRRHWNHNNYGQREVATFLEANYNGNPFEVKSDGEVVKPIQADDSPAVMAMDYNEPFRPKADKQGLGFTEQLGTIISYSTEYKSMEPVTINNQTYAIVEYKQKYGIVDSEGLPISPAFDFNYKSIRFNTFRDDNHTQLIYVEQASDNKWCIKTLDGKNLADNMDERPENELNKFFRIKKGGKWGILNWDGSTLIEPKYDDELYRIGVAYISENEYYTYFPFKMGTETFFVDENGVEYR